MKKITIQNEGDIKSMLLYACGKLGISEKMMPVLMNELQTAPRAEGGFEVTLPAVDENAADPIVAFIEGTLAAVGFKKATKADDKKDAGKGGQEGDEQPKIKNPWLPENLNFTEQLRIRSENSVLADRLEKEAEQTNTPKVRNLVRGFEC